MNSFAIAGGLMWALFYVVEAVRRKMGEDNISGKALVDPIFLL